MNRSTAAGRNRGAAEKTGRTEMSTEGEKDTRRQRKDRRPDTEYMCEECKFTLNGELRRKVGEEAIIKRNKYDKVYIKKTEEDNKRNNKIRREKRKKT